METLASFVRREGPLNEWDAVGWIIRLCKRVEELHKLGVAHGNLSGDSVLIEAVSRTAKGVLVDPRHSPTMVAYHCPERLGGGGVSQADDTWAIAIALYFALTGVPPYPGDSPAEVQARMAEGAPVPLSAHQVGDGALWGALEAFLARSLLQRVVKVSSLREALEKWHPDPDIRELGPLEEAPGDSFAPAYDIADEDDEDEDNIRTVMRDFSEVRKQLSQLHPVARPSTEGQAAPPRMPPPPRAKSADQPSSDKPAAPEVTPSPFDGGAVEMFDVDVDVDVDVQPPSEEDPWFSTVRMDTGTPEIAAAIGAGIQRGESPAATAEPAPQPGAVEAGLAGGQPPAPAPAAPAPGKGVQAGAEPWSASAASPALAGAALPEGPVQPAAEPLAAVPGAAEPAAPGPSPRSLSPEARTNLHVWLVLTVALLFLVVTAVVVIWLWRQGVIALP